jgi:hypothetical protein
MLVLPLVEPLGTSDEPVQRPKVMFRQLKRDGEGCLKRNEEGRLEWDQSQDPVRWQASLPLRIPVDGALVLEEGDIMFVVVEVVTKPENADESQAARGGSKST